METTVAGSVLSTPGARELALMDCYWRAANYLSVGQIYPTVSENAEGMRKLFRQFSFPGGIPSHAAAQTPGSINEGGELGYSLVHAYGAVFDNPGLIAACVIGDGEAEIGPLAALDLFRVKLDEHYHYVWEHGGDLPEVRDWQWQNSGRSGTTHRTADTQLGGEIPLCRTGGDGADTLQ